MTQPKISHLTALPIRLTWHRNGRRTENRPASIIAMGPAGSVLVIRKEDRDYTLYTVTAESEKAVEVFPRQAEAKAGADTYITAWYADYVEAYNTRQECVFLAPSDVAGDRLAAWERAVASGDRETALTTAQAEANEIQADRMAAATTRKANADAAAVGLTSLGANADDAIEYAGAHAFRPGRRNWRGEVEADRCAYPDCGSTKTSPNHTKFTKAADSRKPDSGKSEIKAAADFTPAVSPHQPLFTLTETTTTYAFQVETTKLVAERDNGRGAYYTTIRPTGVAVYVVNGAVRMVTLSGPRQAPDGGDSWQQGTVTFNLAAKDTNPPAIVGWALGAVADAEKQISRPDSLTTAASDKN